MQGVKEQIPEMNDPKLIEGQQIESMESNKGTLKVWTNGNDPYIWLTIDKDQLYPVLEKRLYPETVDQEYPDASAESTAEQWLRLFSGKKC